jgi:hypothetical protein
MKFFSTIVPLFLSLTIVAQTITVKDLQLLPGSWKGSLTYIDYASGKPYTMPANAAIVQTQQVGQYLVAFTYPGEPKANGTDTFLISQNGKLFNGAKIVQLQHLENGGVIITTVQDGRDGNDNKKAILKHTYTIQKNIFINRKEVKFYDEKKWMLRNEYRFNRQ